MRIVVDVVEIEQPCRDLEDLAVIFPAYNEEENVRRAIETAIAVGVGHVVCVDDCSTDRTGQIIEDYRDLPTVAVVHHEVNQGKQAAVKHALLAALERPGIEKFATLDADMQDDPRELRRVAAPVGRYDMASAFRSRDEMPSLRQLANDLANIPYRCLAGLNLHDVQAGFRIYARPVAQHLAENLAPEGGYTLEHTSMPLLGQLVRRWDRPLSIAEVRTPCPYGEAESHIGLSDNLHLARAAVRCAWQLCHQLRR